MAYAVTTCCLFFGGRLLVPALQGPGFDASITGFVDRGALVRLLADQPAFAGLFFGCEGKSARAKEALGLSYPTVENRLVDLLPALRYSMLDLLRAPAQERGSVVASLSSGDSSPDRAIEPLLVA